MLGLLRRFAFAEGGNFGVIAAVSLVPVIGMTGYAVDVSQAYSARTTLQGEADALAIAVAAEGPEVGTSRYYDTMRAAAVERVTLGEARFSGSWISETDYRVTAVADVPRNLSRLIPVGGPTLEVGAVAIARYGGTRLVYKEPERALLDPEAGDFNRVYAYCYDAAKGRENPEAGRSKRTAIADNGGTEYTDPFPQCSVGETLSFELYNSRNARGHKPNWDNSGNEHYSYHTDTVRDADQRETYDLGGWAILETVLCPTLEQCKNRQDGGVIPFGKNRTPERNTQACEPGKYMYYGWEDRPPGRGHSDRDYDDIRVIIECPKVEKLGVESVRLVH